MISHQDRHRIGKARLLRRQGKTYDEIKTAIGWVSEDQLRQWMKGIPRPRGTFRAKSMDELRQKCRLLRLTGLTYDDIAVLTGVSTGSLSLWLRDLPRDFPGGKERRLARLQETCAKKRAARAAVKADQIALVAKDVGPLTDRELLLVGAALYWAEGAKSKPWRLSEHITFVNSDPRVIAVFLRWLELVGVERSECRFHLSIHETADVRCAERYWADLVGVDVSTFNQTSIKRHNPKSVRYNSGEGYHGCLVVNVLKSASLYRQVEGWWQGIVVGAEREIRPRVLD
jgi:hypothetical protein